jgi:hypothetical protein
VENLAVATANVLKHPSEGSDWVEGSLEPLVVKVAEEAFLEGMTGLGRRHGTCRHHPTRSRDEVR